MTGYPLKRLNFSNEKLQALLFAGITLYLIPVFTVRPSNTVRYVLLLAISLLIDSICNFIRYRKVLCSVSASITSAVIFALIPNFSLGLQILSVFIALIPGKHLWGGTGKNMFNPAVLGVLVIYIIKSGDIEFLNTYSVTPLIILFIPFIKNRIYPVAGFIAGGLLVIYISGWSFNTVSDSGLLFLAFVALTDPVTVGSSFLIGIISLVSTTVIYFYTRNLLITILFINMTSYIVDEVLNMKYKYRPLKLKKLFEITEVPEKEIFEGDNKYLNKDQLLSMLLSGDITGLGGAGFSFYRKLETLQASKEKNKYLIINGAECDPGLMHDKWVTDNYLDEIDNAVLNLKKIVDFKDVILGSKSSVREGNNYKSVIIKDYYPVGAERILIKELLGVSLDNNDITAEKGYLVTNIQTLLNIHKLLCNKDTSTKYITIGNLDTGEAKIVKVRRGESIKSVLNRSNIDTTRLFTGGGVMAATSADENDIITDKVNSIYYGKADRYKESPQCSKCNLCNIHCPAGINVRYSWELAKKDLNSPDSNKCIKCGSCSYICLAGRNLAAVIINNK